MKMREMDGKKFDIQDKMLSFGVHVPENAFEIKIENAECKFHSVMKEFMNAQRKTYKQKDDYTQITDWLTDNKGLGLAIMGGCGLGKTIISKYVIPFIIAQEYGKVFSIYDSIRISNMSKLEDILRNKFIVLDDIGAEEVISDFGTRVDMFSIVMDSVEKENKTIIFNTNLDKSRIIERYNERVYERIKATTKLAVITGESLR